MYRIDKELSWVGRSHTWKVSRFGYLIGQGGMRLHRLLMLAGPGEIVDHINGDRLDNRLSNLRIVTASQNCMNRYKARGVSCVKGVSWDSKRLQWKASIKYAGVHYTIGRYPSIEAAARAYRLKELEYFKQHARRL